LFSALAMADSSVFFTSRAMRLREKVRSASALSTFLPRISWAKQVHGFCGLTRRKLVTALSLVFREAAFALRLCPLRLALFALRSAA